MLSKAVADLFQEYTQSGGVRPFGIGMIVAGFDESLGAQIYQVEASGTFYCWKATALGRGATEAKQFLEKTYTDDLDIGDATHLAIKALKNSFDGEMTARNIEVGIIKQGDPKKEFKILSQEEIQDLLREVEWAPLVVLELPSSIVILNNVWSKQTYNYVMRVNFERIHLGFGQIDRGIWWLDRPWVAYISIS